MIKKFAQFWIENTKVTIVLLLITVFAWIWSYIVIPKQYNPDITVPAFNIIVPAPWFSAKEVNHLVVEPLEDKVNQIKWIDHIYGVANKNFWVITVRFLVWSNREKATTRLYNKIYENLWNKPIWVKDPVIESMNTDDFPIYSFALVNTDKTWDIEKTNISLRKTAIDIQDELRFIPWTSVFYLVWWFKDNINIIPDINKLNGKNIDIMQIYQAIKKNNLTFPWWEIKLDKIEWNITVDANLDSIGKLKKLIVWNYNWQPIYLEEVASIFRWVPSVNQYTFVNSNIKQIWKDKNAVFIWIAKKHWVNSVSLAKNIDKKLKEIEKKLPSNYKIIKVSDLWQVANKATNSLMINLFESIIIVFFVLLVYLWGKDAINNAFAIPLTLLAVFLIAFILWDNINRIVLFALILALWMLVDNSTVVIENMARHIKERKEWENVKHAILKAVDEVWTWVVLATITRILALIAMFFVTWMMWAYMWWVPKYVIISLIVSLFIAFSINPFLAYYFARNKKVIKKDKNTIEKKNKLTLVYEKLMWYLLNKKKGYRRIIFKLLFWISLFAVIIIPPVLWIFKMWMLPKDNRNQIYIWVDWNKDWSVKKSKEVADYMNNFLTKYEFKNQKDLNKNNQDIIKNIAYRIGTAPIIDFSNAFRWIDFRQNPNQISMQVNLIDKTKRNLSSIDFTMSLRNQLEKYVRSKYPHAKIRVLEDPAWPPTRSAFMLKIQWNRDIDYSKLETLTKYIKEKINPILKKDDVVDVYTTIWTYKTNYQIKINHQLATNYWLNAEQIAYSIYNMFYGNNVSLVHNSKTKEPINIHLELAEKDKDKLNIFNNLTFMNSKWQKIYLKQFAKIVPTKTDDMIYTEDKYKSVYIYGELWDNTIVYPAWDVTLAMFKPTFWWNKFSIIKKNPYGISIKSKESGEVYRIMWWWERELSLNTFRDLWIAMFMALLAIYFLMVAQFKSFKIAWVIMMTFLIWFFWIFPWFALVHETLWVIFTAPSMIWVIALAWIVVGNAIILIEYLNVLLEKWLTKDKALIQAWSVRMRAIIITSMTTILGSFTILWDPVWWWLGWAIVWWLTASAILTLIVIPVFLYDNIETKLEETVNIDYEN